MAGEHVLPVDASLAGLFPEGLRRGEVIGVQGTAAVSCALALAAGPSGAGAWTVVVGLPGLGVGSAAALGVVPERLVVLVPVALTAIVVLPRPLRRRRQTDHRGGAVPPDQRVR
jgi:hypothetical protein